MHFHLVMAAWEIGVFPAVPFYLVIIEITILLFDALRGKLSTYDNNNCCAKCKYLPSFPRC